MKIAIVGAGFAGVAACYVLSRAGHEVTLHDEKGIGAGASGASPGLLHPYPGRFPGRASEPFEKALELLEAAGKGTIRSRGIVRLALGEAQGAHFRKMARRMSDVEEMEGGVLLKEGVTVNTKAYLEGLFAVSSARFVQERADDPQCEVVVYANGADVPLEVERVKGQALVLKWPEGIPPLPYSVIGKKYLAMEGENCVVGATFEKEFDSPTPNLQKAKEELLTAALKIVPELSGAEVVGVRAGIRAHLPGRAAAKVIQLDARRYAIAGLGSKGLLTHALLAQNLLDLMQR